MPRLPRHRRITHWVTLLALMLAALAPSLSHALALAQGEQAPWALVCSVDRSQQRGNLPMERLPSVFEHCPYCALTNDLPMLPARPLAGLPRASAIEVMPAALPQVPGVTSVWRRAQPRAPPQAA